MSKEPLTLSAALLLGRGQVSIQEVRILLRYAVGCDATLLIAHPDQTLTKAQSQKFQDWLARRVAGEPIAYLVGEREFYGHTFRVSPAVLIPRHETELLVERALQNMEQLQKPQVLDLGTGSGAIAVSIKLARPDAQVWALDQSVAALEVAQANAQYLSADVRFLQSNWFAALGSDQRFDIIVSNPPYIAPNDVHLEQGDLRFEPRSALEASDKGLADIRVITQNAPNHLLPGGYLLFEHGYDQAESARALMAQTGFAEVQSLRDLAGIERVTLGCSE